MTLAHNLAQAAAFVLTTTLALTACRGDDPLDSAGMGTDTSTSDGDDSTSSSSSSSGVPTTSTGSSSTTGEDPTTGEPTTTNMSAGFITTDTTTGTSGPSMPGENGAECSNDADCVSMNCYTNPIIMGGICSECNEDSDCVDAGTGISCSLSPNGAVCAAGGYGNQCMSQEACQDGLICGPAIDIPIPGIIPDTCGECESSADCDMDMICSPELDIAAFSGAKKCVAPGSVMNGALCPLGESDADAACMSGQCAEVDVMMFLTLGVCGDCKSDADCMGGQTCTPGSLGQGGAMGSVCE